MFITGHRFSRNSSRGATENCLESDLAFQRPRSLIRFTIIFQDRDTIIRIIDDTYSSFAAHATTKRVQPSRSTSRSVHRCSTRWKIVILLEGERERERERQEERESTFSCCRIRKRTITEYVWITYANHCNSCSLIISASISYSKPPANADRTLSLSRSPHFAPLYRSISIPPPSHLPHPPPLELVHLYVVYTRATSSDNTNRGGLYQPLLSNPTRVGNARAVDTVNNLITIHRQCVVSH